MMYMVIKAANGGPSSGPELLLMLGGFFAGISGISIFAGSNMKQGIHPESYRLVAFRDMSNGHTFLTKSTEFRM